VLQLADGDTLDLRVAPVAKRLTTYAAMGRFGNLFLCWCAPAKPWDILFDVSIQIQPSGWRIATSPSTCRAA
jgi:hypothetical protein